MNVVDDTMNLRDFILTELEKFVEISLQREMSVGDYVVFKSRDDNQKRNIKNLFRIHDNLIFEVINNDIINIPVEKWDWLNPLEPVVLKFEEQSGKTVTIHKTKEFLY